MDVQTARKTMLTHVFKPRWLVLILLSAGNCERERKRRERESNDIYIRERESAEGKRGPPSARRTNCRSARAPSDKGRIERRGEWRRERERSSARGRESH